MLFNSSNSISYFVSILASLIFIPLAPIAFDFCSGTSDTIAFCPSIFTELTIAGAKARATKIAGSLLYSIASIFSPFNSLLTALILTPFMPTVAPTASIFGVVEYKN